MFKKFIHSIYGPIFFELVLLNIIQNLSLLGKKNKFWNPKKSSFQDSPAEVIIHKELILNI